MSLQVVADGGELLGVLHERLAVIRERQRYQAMSRQPAANVATDHAVGHAVPGAEVVNATGS